MDDFVVLVRQIKEAADNLALSVAGISRPLIRDQAYEQDAETTDECS
ncbi:MAG: hypothetical protein R3F04_01130 [Lysobacteraceae bacterium]